IKNMQRQKGVEEVHVIPADGPDKAKLCFHYQPDEISIEQLQRTAEKEGAAITAKFGHIVVEINGILTFEQADMLEHRLQASPGIVSASVSGTGHIRIEFDQDQTNRQVIFEFIEQAGYKIAAYIKKGSVLKNAGPHPASDPHEHTHEHIHNHEHGGGGGWKSYLPVIISFILLAAGILMDNFIHPPFFGGIVRFLWYAAAYIPVGWPVVKRG